MTFPIPRRRVRSMLVAGTVSLAAVGILAWRLPWSWSGQIVNSIALTSELEANRLHFARGRASFDAIVFRIHRDHARAKLVDLPEPRTLAAIGSESGATLAVNGGYFDASFEPLGLMRIDGADHGTLSRQAPLSGFVVIDHDGNTNVVTLDDPAVASTTSAFQAGPFLIDPGGQIGIHFADGKSTERTIIACNGDELSVIVTGPTTLLDLAQCLHDDPRSFGMTHVDRAINLDGGPSSGWWLDASAMRSMRLPRGRVRNVLLFGAR